VAKASAFKGRGVQPTQDVARLAIAALARGQRVIVPNFAGRLSAWLVRFFPVGWITYLVEKAARPGKPSA
jgi:short-subunit dehydrogenase